MTTIDPTSGDIQMLYCRCETKKPVRVGLYDAWECATCRRGIKMSESKITSLSIDGVDLTDALGDDEDDDIEDILAPLMNARVRFWTCPVREHRRVEWRGDIAHCMTCDNDSSPT